MGLLIHYWYTYYKDCIGITSDKQYKLPNDYPNYQRRGTFDSQIVFSQIPFRSCWQTSFWYVLKNTHKFAMPKSLNGKNSIRLSLGIQFNYRETAIKLPKISKKISDYHFLHRLQRLIQKLQSNYRLWLPRLPMHRNICLPQREFLLGAVDKHLTVIKKYA